MFKSRLSRSLIVAAMASLPGAALAQQRAVPDHGRVLAACMEVVPGRLTDTTKRSDTTNYVFRGRLIALNPERTMSLCFDTELMRVAGAWIGKPVAYTADKNMGPAVDGSMLFATRPGPGWARKGKWDDPRQGNEGPLPRTWAHYRGLYVHGDKVVLSYRVGDCDVLEMPGAAQVEGVAAVTRRFDIGPTTTPQEILVCQEPGYKGVTFHPLVEGDGTSPHVMEIDRGTDRLVAVVVGAPGAGFSIGPDKRFYLGCAAQKSGLNCRLIVAPLPPGKGIGPLAKLLQADVEPLRRFTKGGPARWKARIETKGAVAPAGKAPYAVDDIGLPVANPWHASVRLSGLDFFPDGRAALCTWDGDVWIVSGLDGKLDQVRWQRYAAGLQQPLGLKIVDGFIYTAGRDQITKLHDLNGDGEADFYENFNNDAPLTLQRHEFVMDLQTDARGNFYYGRSGHYLAPRSGANCCVYKVSPDGKKLEVFARGFREPNGLSIGPDGTMIAGDNEGNGIPQTPLYRLKAGAFYGFTPSRSEDLGVKGSRWEYARLPIVWLPKNVDRSAGSQVWVPDSRFGPLAGQLLHTSYGQAALYSVLIDRRAEPWQGAVWRFPLGFNSGVMRARFNPKDGQLYLCGLRGWETNGVKDGQFCRVRYTGSPVPVPVGFEAGRAGLTVRFSAPLDRAAAEDEENWSGAWSNLIVKAGAAKRAQQELPITGATLSADGKAVTIRLDAVRPASNFALQYRLKAADGGPVAGELHGTIHEGR